MTLLTLAAQVCQAFTEGGGEELRTVQKVKHDHSRDVVTGLDMHLHSISAQFVADHLSDCRLLSEEDCPAEFQAQSLLQGQWLVVDPLDGSNNHARGLPHFGYMAAQLREGRVEAALVVLPEHDQYIVMERSSLLASQTLPAALPSEGGAVYYAYPPRQDAAARQARMELFDLIDTRSSGLYRCGSACVGLYQLLCGQHLAFVGHGIRLWDALAFLPILATHGLTVQYALQGQYLTLVASRSAAFIAQAAGILECQGVSLKAYEVGDVLKVEAA